MRPVAYNAVTSCTATDTLVSLEPLTLRRLKLWLHTTDRRAPGYAGRVVISCIVNSLRRGSSVPLSTRAMATVAVASDKQVRNIKFVQEIEEYSCIYNYTLNKYSNKDVTE